MRTSLLISAALFLALTAAAYAALLDTPAAPQLPAVARPAPAVPFAAAACCTAVPQVAPAADAQAIRESHSDAGYWYYQR